MGESARASAKLRAVRQTIDRLDEQLLRLVNRRARLALKIGRIKKRRKWPVFDATREAFVLRRVQRANCGPLSSAAIRSIFRAILTQCRRRERRLPKRKPR
ncbi:MAG: chorismate mutase [Candidatus Omnitrophica bacterium]|nr:chorismate mutase [Candidatus Omnitrophota bacterium]